MTATLQLVSESEEETRRLGSRLARLLGPGDVVLLSGALGSGKTCLAQGIAAGLGVREPVTSPTFSLVNEYDSKPRLFHLDFYRLERPSEIMEMGFDEYFYGDGITVAEWPERVIGLPPEHLRIHVLSVSERSRALDFSPTGDRYRTVVADFAADRTER